MTVQWNDLSEIMIAILINWLLYLHNPCWVTLICKMTSRLSDSFLRIHDEDPCLLCNRSIKKGDQFNTFTEKGWATLKQNAIKWSNINVPVDDDCYMFPSVQDRVRDRLVFGRGHKGCRRIFSGKINQYQESMFTKRCGAWALAQVR